MVALRIALLVVSCRTVDSTIYSTLVFFFFAALLKGCPQNCALIGDSQNYGPHYSQYSSNEKRKCNMQDSFMCGLYLKLSVVSIDISCTIKSIPAHCFHQSEMIWASQPRKTVGHKQAWTVRDDVLHLSEGGWSSVKYGSAESYDVEAEAMQRKESSQPMVEHMTKD